VVEPNGTAVNIRRTPPGSYDQPGIIVEQGVARPRTDILQRADHGAGHSHTHDPTIHTTPDGRVFGGRIQQPGRPVTPQEVRNIENGVATPAAQGPPRR
jgi:hypothetical protein